MFRAFMGIYIWVGGGINGSKPRLLAFKLRQTVTSTFLAAVVMCGDARPPQKLPLAPPFQRKGFITAAILIVGRF